MNNWQKVIIAVLVGLVIVVLVGKGCERRNESASTSGSGVSSEVAELEKQNATTREKLAEARKIAALKKEATDLERQLKTMETSSKDARSQTAAVAPPTTPAPASAPTTIINTVNNCYSDGSGRPMTPPRKESTTPGVATLSSVSSVSIEERASELREDIATIRARIQEYKQSRKDSIRIAREAKDDSRRRFSESCQRVAERNIARWETELQKKIAELEKILPSTKPSEILHSTTSPASTP